ncbi:HD domain-containing protein [Romboutsia ilealis]|uniref:HD domain-containing protein n=1 Tax=Romboutsia ilealis TaxID=1115758 RepID=UPI00272CC08D|nr:HD domain-containing protein [Romboutsia ilealis]
MRINISTVIDVLDIKNDKTPLLEQLNSIVKKYLYKTDIEGRLDTRIYQHSLRTMKYADKILKKEKADREIVLSALLLHDIGKTITDQRHDIVSYKLAKEILTKLEVDENKKSKILECILLHSSKPLNCLDLTIEQQIVMDADILDEIGVLTITKYCISKMNRNIDINFILKGLEDKYEEIEKEQMYLKTKYGLDLYIKKKKNLRSLIDNFKLEIEMFDF